MRGHILVDLEKQSLPVTAEAPFHTLEHGEH